MRMQDSKQTEKVLEEVSKTLSLMREFKSIEPDPLTFDKISAELNNGTAINRTTPFFMRAAIPSLILIVVLLINVFSFYMILRNSGSPGEKSVNIKDLKTEYQLFVTDYLERITDL